MAAARKKSKPAAKKKSPTKKSPKKREPFFVDGWQWPQKAICFTIFWVFAIVSLFHFGWLGTLFCEVGTLIFGSFFYALLLGGMAWTIWHVWTRGKELLPWRAIWGYVCLSLFWMLSFALAAKQPGQPFSALHQIIADLPLFTSSLFSSNVGLIGALLGGSLAALISRAGLLLVILALLVLGICLIFWRWIRMLMLSPKTGVHPLSGLKRKTREKIEARTKPETSPDDTAGANPAIFDNGVPADFSDLPLEELASPENIVQDPLPGFSIPDPDPVQPEKQTEQPRAKLSRKSRPGRNREEEHPDLSAAPVQPRLGLDSDLENYELPPLSLLQDVRAKSSASNVHSAKEQGARLIEILRQFNVDARLGDIHIGPSVTQFEVIPGTGVRVSTFTSLQNDIKLALAARDIRIEAPIPGKSAVGIEVPNVTKTTVSMKELMNAFPADLECQPLAFCLGKDLTGTNIYGRLDTMPHLLIAGATGSGKSVCVNAILCSLLLRTRPDEVKLLLVDPKKVEFTPYDSLPHLLAPVITDAALASSALKVICQIMDERYDRFEKLSVRNLTAYNEAVRRDPQTHLQQMPRIVVVIDELADLMSVAGKDVEASIQRITQLARAAGIHLIVATQRPSVNVITGTIKANIPSRIAFMVSSRIDAKTILDHGEAEKLLGHGDMLFEDNGASAPRRIQGVFIQDQEVSAICEFVKSQAAPTYNDALVELRRISTQGGDVEITDLDPLYERVREMVVREQKASTSQIQRFFHIGYGRAAGILDQLEANGIIGPSNGTRPREVLVRNSWDQPEEEEENG